MRRAYLIALLTVCLPSPSYSQVPIVPVWVIKTSGTISSNNFPITLNNTAGLGTVALQITGTKDGSIELQCTVDESNFRTLRLTPTDSSTVVTAVTGTATGIWTASIAGCAIVRAFSTLWSSGTASVTILGSPASSGSAGGAGGGASDTELPAATSLTDNVNPTVPGVAAFLMCFDGTLWDRCVVASDATHDSAAASTGPQIMMSAAAHGANPTAVTAGDAVRWTANRAGVPFVIGGHPNVITKTALATAAQDGTALLDITAGTKIVVTRASVKCSADNTAKPDFRLVFDTDTTAPAASASGVVGEIVAFNDIPAGGGFVEGGGGGIVGIGADGEDLRYHLTAPTGGSCNVSVSYYTIES